MKHCPDCGFELFDYAQRCSNCGLRGLGYTNDNIPTERREKGSVRKVGSGRKKGSHTFRIQEVIPEVLELKRCGVSNRRIAWQTGLALNTVKSILPLSYKHKATRGIWATHSGLICDMKQKGHSLQEIGDRVGRSRERIGQLLKVCYGSTRVHCRICNAPVPKTRRLYCSGECYEIGHHQARAKSQWRRLYRRSRRPLPKSLVLVEPNKSPYKEGCPSGIKELVC